MFKISLVEYCAFQLGCEHLSDLHFLQAWQKRKLYRVIESLPQNEGSLWEWNDALAYVANLPPTKTVSEARQKLLDAIAWN